MERQDGLRALTSQLIQSAGSIELPCIRKRPPGGHVAPPEVKLFVDPVCPFAWTAYQWLVDVEASHRIYFDVRIMSLAILNNGSKGYPPEDQRGLDSAWRPVRVAAALELERGQSGLRSYFQAFGQAFHDTGIRPRDEALRAALREVDGMHALPAADDPNLDSEVRRSHDAGVQPVGLPGGTPTLHIDGKAFFGPVLSFPPTGSEALRIFESIRVLIRNEAFSEVRRARY